MDHLAVMWQRKTPGFNHLNLFQLAHSARLFCISVEPHFLVLVKAPDLFCLLLRNESGDYGALAANTAEPQIHTSVEDLEPPPSLQPYSRQQVGLPCRNFSCWPPSACSSITNTGSSLNSTILGKTRSSYSESGLSLSLR